MSARESGDGVRGVYVQWVRMKSAQKRGLAGLGCAGAAQSSIEFESKSALAIHAVWGCVDAGYAYSIGERAERDTTVCERVCSMRHRSMVRLCVW